MPWILLLIAIVCLYGVTGILITNQAIGNHPQWRTLQSRPSEYGLMAETVAFPSLDGIQLTAWWLPGNALPPGGSQATIILAHGRDSNRAGMLSRAAFLVRQGYNVLNIDLRNHGESQGHYITPGYREAFDIQGGVAYLRQHGQTAPIIAFGHSYGAVAALHAAAQCAEIVAVIADSAFTSPQDLLKQMAHHSEFSIGTRLGVQLARLPFFEWSFNLSFFLRTGVRLKFHQSDALQAVKQIGNRPILFIAGEQDWLAPPENAHLLCEAAADPNTRLLIVPEAGHSTTYSTALEHYEAEVLTFLQRTLS